MTLSEANELWYEMKPIDGVMFCYNDSVRIKSGEYAGNGASVISLVALAPVTYLVELGATGEDVIIAESNLEELL